MKHRDIGRILRALSELRGLCEGAELEVWDDYESIQLTGERYTFAGIGAERFPAAPAASKQRRADARAGRGRVIVTLVEASASSVVSFVDNDPPKLVVTTRQARFAAPLAVRGIGPTRLHALSMMFLNANGGVLHRFDHAPGRDLLAGMSGLHAFRFVEAKASLPAGMTRALRTIEIHERAEQQQPLVLAFQIPVVNAPERGAWSLGPWHARNARGPRLVAVDVVAIDDGLEVRATFEASRPGWRHESYELRVLATTAAGLELEAGSAAVVAGQTSAIVLPLAAAARAQVGMFDLRLGGARHHEGVIARFDAHAT